MAQRVKDLALSLQRLWLLLGCRFDPWPWGTSSQKKKNCFRAIPHGLEAFHKVLLCDKSKLQDVGNKNNFMFEYFIYIYVK